MLSWLPEHPDLGRALSEARGIADPVDRFRAAVRLAGHDRDVVATARVDRLAGDGLRGVGCDGGLLEDPEVGPKVLLAGDDRDVV